MLLKGVAMYIIYFLALFSPSLSPSFVCFLADTSPKPAKRPKCAQGFHVSKNAYTLVYTLKGHKGVGKTASSAVVYQK